MSGKRSVEQAQREVESFLPRHMLELQLQEYRERLAKFETGAIYTQQHVQQMCTDARLHGHDEIVPERDRLRLLLTEALTALEDCCEQSEGHRHGMELGCGNCDAGVPMPHSLGCRIRNALKGINLNARAAAK